MGKDRFITKWRMMPRADGGYNLQSWQGLLRGYCHEKVVKDEAEAKEMIENLERPVIELKGEKDE